MLSLADLAIVENEYTAAFARRYCDRVAIITGPVDTCRFFPAARAGTDPERVVLGWIGSPSTLPYLDLIRDVLALLGARYPNLQLHVVGAEGAEFAGLDTLARGWDLQREVEDLQGFDIGLMPMPDDPWTRGKGGYKLLQYMATGLPVVTSPVGVNRQLVRDGHEGFWAADAAAWERCLVALIESPALRQRMGSRGRAAVEARYSLQGSRERLVQLLGELTGAA